MYYIDPEHPPRPNTATEQELDSDATRQCDFCGEPVPRETAVARAGGDGGEPVVLCTKCEFGVE